MDESIFLVPIGKMWARFKFRPSYQIKELLDDYEIPYREGQNKVFKVIEAENTKITKYKVRGSKRWYIFYFTSNIIDKVLDYYRVEYEKGD